MTAPVPPDDRAATAVGALLGAYRLDEAPTYRLAARMDWTRCQLGRRHVEEVPRYALDYVVAREEPGDA